MKYIISLLTMFALSFSLSAKEVLDAKSVQVCGELAKHHNLSGEESKKYISDCVKDIAEIEAEERKKEKAKS